MGKDKPTRRDYTSKPDPVSFNRGDFPILPPPPTDTVLFIGGIQDGLRMKVECRTFVQVREPLKPSPYKDTRGSSEGFIRTEVYMLHSLPIGDGEHLNFYTPKSMSTVEAIKLLIEGYRKPLGH